MEEPGNDAPSDAPLDIAAWSTSTEPAAGPPDNPKSMPGGPATGSLGKGADKNDHGVTSWSLSKLAPIIGAIIIGAATITAALISTRGRTSKSPSTQVVVTEAAATEVAVVESTGPVTTVAPQVIIVQVPGTSPSGPPTIPGPVPTVTVIVTVTVPTPIEPTTTRAAGVAAPTTVVGEVIATATPGANALTTLPAPTVPPTTNPPTTVPTVTITTVAPTSAPAAIASATATTTAASTIPVLTTTTQRIQ